MYRWHEYNRRASLDYNLSCWLINYSERKFYVLCINKIHCCAMFCTLCSFHFIRNATPAENKVIITPIRTKNKLSVGYGTLLPGEVFLGCSLYSVSAFFKSTYDITAHPNTIVPMISKIAPVRKYCFVIKSPHHIQVLL